MVRCPRFCWVAVPFIVAVCSIEGTAGADVDGGEDAGVFDAVDAVEDVDGADEAADEAAAGCVLENFLPDPLVWLEPPSAGEDAPLITGYGTFLDTEGFLSMFVAHFLEGTAPVDTDIVLTPANWQAANIVLLHNTGWREPSGFVFELGLVSTGGTLRFTHACHNGIAGTLTDGEFTAGASWSDFYPMSLDPEGCTLSLPGTLTFDFGVGYCPDGSCDPAACGVACVGAGHSGGECVSEACECLDGPACSEAECVANSPACGCSPSEYCNWIPEIGRGECALAYCTQALCEAGSTVCCGTPGTWNTTVRRCACFAADGDADADIGADADGDDATDGGGGIRDSGCGCRITGSHAATGRATAGLLILAVAIVFRRRRKDGGDPPGVARFVGGRGAG